MISNIAVSPVLAHYECKSPSPAVWLLPGLLIGGIIAYRLIGETGEERLVTLVLLVLLVIGVGGVGLYSWLTGLRRVELTASGTVDFISKARRESLPRAALVRIEGKTNTSGRWQRGGGYRSRRTHSSRFVFTGSSSTDVVKQIRLLDHADADFQNFVRQLEHANPKLDTSRFWAWALSEI